MAFVFQPTLHIAVDEFCDSPIALGGGSEWGLRHNDGEMAWVIRRVPGEAIHVTGGCR